MTAPLLELDGLDLDTLEGRPLFRDLHLSLGRDRVAIVGRNGVGKSTLLRLLAGEGPTTSKRVARVEPVLVHQEIDLVEARLIVDDLRQRADADPSKRHVIERALHDAGLPPLPRLDAVPSRGQARKLLLLQAWLDDPELLLLDEPTEGLDEAGIDWLCREVERWEGGLVVVSHHRALLRRFRHFFVVAEGGCRAVPGSLADLLQLLEQEDAAQQRRYARHLNVLVEQEELDERIRRRRQRKKNVGRLHELRRRTSRARLNEKRGHAQESQAKAARIRRDRIDAVRGWAKATRRALAVTLPLELPSPRLEPSDGRPLVRLDGVGMARGDRTLWSGLDLAIGRERLAVTGPNGAGKTTLLQVLLGECRPSVGTAWCRRERIGVIAQGGTDWESDESLLERLHRDVEGATLEQLATQVVEHRFPLALAERPLRSLSPGERVRAALICLYARAPTVELLVLDEPTQGLDFVGIAALERALRAWPGGLVVASHDRELLGAIGIDRELRLDGHGGVEHRDRAPGRSQRGPAPPRRDHPHSTAPRPSPSSTHSGSRGSGRRGGSRQT